jgi:hypothetical protein
LLRWVRPPPLLSFHLQVGRAASLNCPINLHVNLTVAVGGWFLVVGGQHLAAPLRITHPVPDNTITTHCDAAPNLQPPTTFFGVKDQ